MTRWSALAIVVLCASIGCSGRGLELSSSALLQPPCPVTDPSILDATPDGTVSRWEIDGRCVSVTYDPRIADLSPTLAAAVAEWNGLACNPLCLDAPVEGPLDSDQPTRTIRVGPWDNPISSSYTRATLRYQSDHSGRISSAELDLNVIDFTFDEPTLVIGLGKTLGLGGEGFFGTHLVPPGADLSPIIEVQEAAECQLYGTSCGP
jgi:hypothetical protein